jgi:hypothetical protein
MTSQQISSLEMLWTKCTLKEPCIAGIQQLLEGKKKQKTYKSLLIVAHTFCLQHPRAAHALCSDKQFNFKKHFLLLRNHYKSPLITNPYKSLLIVAHMFCLQHPRAAHALCLDQQFNF